jgi:hypothetical protein
VKRVVRERPAGAAHRCGSLFKPGAEGVNHVNVYCIGGAGEIHRVPGWSPEALVNLPHALNVIREAKQFKTPVRADMAIRGVMEFAQKELGSHLETAGVVVIE